MRYRLTIIALAGAALALSAPAAWSERADEAAIRATLNRYFSGKADTMATAFAPGASMIYVRDSLIIVPIPEFIARIRSQEAQAAAQPRQDNAVKRIASVDIAGNAAIARLETERGERLVVDYMSLLNIGGEWLIVNKSFDMVPLKKKS